MKLNAAFSLGFLVLGMTAIPARAAVVDARYTNTVAQMTAYITNQMAVNNIPGLSIALVDDQTVVWSEGFGYADREAGVTADADTVYHIGSCSKAFLGTAYMQLLDWGLVDIETNLTRYIPEYTMLARFTNSGPVTVRSLLNHHSGIPGDFFNGMIATRPIDNYAPWLIACLQDEYPFAPVNERNYYCNNGFLLLSEAVLRITGTNFADATDAMIFTPLGMEASSFLPDKAAISNRMAASYSTEGDRQPSEFLNCLGSGSMYSSANDLTRYISMILADGRFNGQTLVSSNGIDIMTTAQGTNLPLNVSGSFPGLGWDDVNDHRLRYAGKFFWKDGATYMHSAFLGMSRDRKLGVAVIQNTAGSQCDAIGIETLRWAVLDKTVTNHWPTNTFVPDPSPVTNRPQEELDALAGLYVGDSGYNKIESAPGSLTFLLHADTDKPTIRSNLVPRANGWFSPTNSQNHQFAFTNLAGHDMLVLHSVSGPFEEVNPLGEHYLPVEPPQAWNNRTNRIYRMLDMHPDDYFWVSNAPYVKTLRFRVKDNAVLSDWLLGSFVIEPQNDNMAFQRGTHYRKGGAVQVATTNNFEILNYSSIRFIDEAAIPTLPLSTITNGSIPFANGTQWFWFDGQSGKTYRARVTAPGRSYYVRITDREGMTLRSAANAPADWHCASNGVYAIAVCATNPFDFGISLTVGGNRQVRNDYDGDGKADPVVYNADDGVFTVFMSGSDYSAPSVQFPQTAGYAFQPVAGDYDGDGLADPAVYDPTANQLLVRRSSQSYALATTPMGESGCVAIAGDFDGDRISDPAVYSSSAGRLTAWLSGSDYAAASAPLGGPGWVNACEDYDGDGRTDPAACEPLSGTWQVLFSGDNYAAYSLQTAGGAGVVAVPDDYDGDGLADPTEFQPASGLWLFALSTQGYAQSLNYGLGNPTILPRPADYDNDGKADLALLDPMAGVFYTWLSGADYRLFSLSW